MFNTPKYQKHTVSVLCLVSLQAGVFFSALGQAAVAQTELVPEVSPPPAGNDQITPANDAVSPQFNNYRLGAGDGITVSVQGIPERYRLASGDVIGITVQRPAGVYRLGPGDVISVQVQRFPDLSFQAAINPEGNITVPLLGTVSLARLSLAEAQTRISTGLNRFVVNPIVTLTLTQQRPELSFSAQVSPEGNVVVPQLGTVSVAGLTVAAAQARIRAGLRRFTVDPIVTLSLARQRIPLDFQALINPEGNITVPQLGTVSLAGLTLPEAQEKIRLGLRRYVENPEVALSLTQQRPVQVTITGEVVRPGIYPVQSPRVADALVLAGGSTMTADLRAVQVRRKLVDGSIITQNLDLYSALQNADSVPDLRLQDGDAIVIPKRELGTDDGYDRTLVSRSTLAQQKIRIRVLSYANQQIATIELANGSSFIDALAGINPDGANLREIALVRFDPERGKAVTRKLDAKKALSGDASQNVPLQDNDVIVVGRNLIGRITNALSTITRPFFDIQGFIRFFDFFGGNNRR